MLVGYTNRLKINNILLHDKSKSFLYFFTEGFSTII
jgi:hypothetical protein